MPPLRRRPVCRLRHREDGQATVELAMVVPVVFGLILLVVQTAVVGRDQLLVVAAARDASRAAALTGDIGTGIAAGRAATGLRADELVLDVAIENGYVRVVARYPSPIVVPVLRRTRDSVVVSATVRMPIEEAAE